MFWTLNIQKSNILPLAERERPEPRRNQWFRRDLEQLSVRVLEPKEHFIMQKDHEVREVHTTACSDSKALYTKGRTSANIYGSIIRRKRNG